MLSVSHNQMFCPWFTTKHKICMEMHLKFADADEFNDYVNSEAIKIGSCIKQDSDSHH